MAKSIRAKCKKRARTIKRNTIGEAQDAKESAQDTSATQQGCRGGANPPTDAAAEAVAAAAEGALIFEEPPPFRSEKAPLHVQCRSAGKLAYGKTWKT